MVTFFLSQATPTISQVVQKNFNTHEVVWSVDDPENKTQLTRYRVKLTRGSEAFEWPALINRVQYDSSEPAYKELQTESNFECFNECVQDSECVMAVRSSNQSGVNCFLKNSVTAQNSLDVDPDTEYGLVGSKSQN